jgi:hypothetical protein
LITGAGAVLHSTRIPFSSTLEEQPGSFQDTPISKTYPAGGTMFDLPHHHAWDNRAGEAKVVVARPRFFPGETVEGFVVAEITPYPRPVRSVSIVNVNDGPEGFIADNEKTNDIYWAAQGAAQSAPALAQFVLAVVEYPSGPVSRWGRLRWSAVEIVLRSPHEWPAVAGDAPPETPDLRRLVDELARQAAAQGWEPVERGRTWCSLRFRQQYACLGDALRWK